MATSQDTTGLLAEKPPVSAFGQLFNMAVGTGLSILNAKADTIVAREVVRQDVAKQSAASMLAQQSSNLGPNDVAGANLAAKENASLMFGVSPSAVIAGGKRFPLLIVVGVIVVAYLAVKYLRK